MTTIVNVKVDQKVKQQAQRVAEDLGFTLSGIINVYLRQLVRTKTVFVSEKYEEPSDFLAAALEEARLERSQGKNFTFSSNEEAVNFIDKVITDSKNKV